MNNIESIKIKLNEYLTILKKLNNSYSQINQFSIWQDIIQKYINQIDNNKVKFAVIGSLKSGKTTFTNTLINKDILKRAPGVVTSVITEIYHGNNFNLEIKLQTDTFLNNEIRYSIFRLPIHNNKSLISLANNIDINNPDFHTLLEDILSNKNLNELMDSYTRDRYYKYLSKISEGYEEVKVNYSNKNLCFNFSNQTDKDSYLKWITNEKYSVYVEKAILKLPFTDLNKDLILYDSQGSDSTYFRHNYLLTNFIMQTNLLIYVISSRIGPRQADINLLEKLKEFNLLKNIFFIINIDINEHNNLEEVRNLINICKNDIMNYATENNIAIFSFSTLYHLFNNLKSTGKNLSKIEEMQYEIFKEKNDIIEFSNTNYQKFMKQLNTVIIEDKTKLLVNTIPKRLQDLKSKILLKSEIINSINSNTKSTEINSILKDYSEQLDSINGILENGKNKTKNIIDYKIKNIFHNNKNSIYKNIVSFVKNYNPDPKKIFLKSNTGNFNEILSIIYQNFIKQFDAFIETEFIYYIFNSIKPVILETILSIENIKKNYNNFICKIITDYNDYIEKNNISLHSISVGAFEFEEQLHIKKFTIPKYKPIFGSELSYKLYSYFLRFNLFSNKTIKYLVNKIKKNEVNDINFDGNQFETLSKSVNFIKRNIIKSLTKDIVNLRENVKYKTFYNVIEKYIKELENNLKSNLEIFSSNIIDNSIYKNMSTEEKSNLSTFLKQLSEL